MLGGQCGVGGAACGAWVAPAARPTLGFSDQGNGLRTRLLKAHGEDPQARMVVHAWRRGRRATAPQVGLWNKGGEGDVTAAAWGKPWRGRASKGIGRCWDC